MSMAMAMESTTGTRFRRIFGSEHTYVLGVLRRLGIRGSDAEDVAHDVFVVFLRRIGDYDRSRPIRPWLRAIATRVAADHRRLARHRHERLVGDETDELRGTASTSDAWIAALDLVRILDQERKSILVLHDILGYSMPEITSRLGIPLNTGYTRLRLARASLRAIA